MINLLPPENTRQLQAARHNTILLRYVIGAGIVLGLIILVYVIAFVLMKSTELASSAASEENKAKIAAFKAVETEAKTHTANLQLAKSIFASELSYPTALHRVASALPPATVLQSLDLNPTTISQPVTLTVLAKTTGDALKVKESLEKAKVASNITIGSLTESVPVGEGAIVDEYHVSLSLNLTFDKAIFSPEEKKDE